jgi:nucleotide-binding universal stress UspA family protein
MFQKIVIGTDGSATAGSAVRHAVELARMSGGTLHIVAACKLPSTALVGGEAGAILGGPADAAWEEDARAQVDGVLKEAGQAAKEAGIEVETHPVLGDPADALITVARETGADLIVVGSRGMSGLGRVLGSVPNKVSHHAPCDLLIVHTA